MPPTTIWSYCVAVHVGLGLCRSDAILEPGHYRKPRGFPLEVADIARQNPPGVDVGRHGGVRGEIDAEILRQHADHLRAPAIHEDGAPDDRPIAAEAPLPQAVAQDHLAGRELGIRLAELLGIDRKRILGDVGPAQDRLDPEEAQQVVRDVGVGDPLRRPVAGEGAGNGNRAGELLELGGLGLVVLEVGSRDQRAGDVGGGQPGPHERQPVGVLEGQGAEQNRVRYAEDRHGAADAQREREEDDAREERSPGEGADRVPHVTKDIPNHGDTA
jgi:hypothetical protein